MFYKKAENYGRPQNQLLVYKDGNDLRDRQAKKQIGQETERTKNQSLSVQISYLSKASLVPSNCFSILQTKNILKQNPLYVNFEKSQVIGVRFGILQFIAGFEIKKRCKAYYQGISTRKK